MQKWARGRYKKRIIYGEKINYSAFNIIHFGRLVNDLADRQALPHKQKTNRRAAADAVVIDALAQIRASESAETQSLFFRPCRGLSCDAAAANVK